MLIETLAKNTQFSKSQLLSLARTSDVRYKTYTIKKRSGGTRIIHHPSKELKSVQRWLVHALVGKLPIHEAATAYKKGSSIRENALRHQKSRFTNRYDFANFFPSFTQEKVEFFISENVKEIGVSLSHEDIKFAGDILCRKQLLTIGAPSSPSITNAMMFDFDRAVSNSCVERKLVYTRYADDIFVSSHQPDQLFDFEELFSKILSQIPHLSLAINPQKTAYLSKKHARKITGIVITSDNQLSVGRRRKREVKALVHRWIIGELPLEKIHYMRGMLAFVRDVEPNFENSIRAKYGDSAINEILHNPNLETRPDPSFKYE